VVADAMHMMVIKGRSKGDGGDATKQEKTEDAEES
jgi:hypothetical protein